MSAKASCLPPQQQETMLAQGIRGFTVQKHPFALVTKVTKIKSRPLMALKLLSYPHSHLSEEEEEHLHHQLKVTVSEIPSHNVLAIHRWWFWCADQRQVLLRPEYSQNRGICRGVFKSKQSFRRKYDLPKTQKEAWKGMHPAGHFSQIDYIIYRKWWRNSVHDC